MTPATPIQSAIQANLSVIHQGITLLRHLGADRYRGRVSLCYNGSVGGHMRHIVEHYQSFLRGLTDGEIDYEKRSRDPLVENDPAYATGILESVTEQLDEWSGLLTNSALKLCVETSPGITTATSVLRELEFLLSHTIHHYALVAIMARLQGYEPESTFGVAPSTLKFQRSQAACAR